MKYHNSFWSNEKEDFILSIKLDQGKRTKGDLILVPIMGGNVRKFRYPGSQIKILMLLESMGFFHKANGFL